MNRIIFLNDIILGYNLHHANKSYEAFKIKRKGETIWKNLKTKLVQIFKKN